MKNLHNIEKSAFNKGEYVGYGHGTVYRIIKNRDLWRAVPRGHRTPECTLPFFECDTLASVSIRLDRE